MKGTGLAQVPGQQQSAKDQKLEHMAAEVGLGHAQTVWLTSLG